MNIPTEFYEEEYLEFEDYMKLTGNIRRSTKESPYENSEYTLQMFSKYEKFVQKENKKLIKKQRKEKTKCKKDDSKVLKAVKGKYCGLGSGKSAKALGKVI